MRKRWARTRKSLVTLVASRRPWVQKTLVTAVAAGVAWEVGDLVVTNGGLVAAIAAALSVRISLHKSVREGFGQIFGTAIGAGAALLAVACVEAVCALATPRARPSSATIPSLNLIRMVCSLINEFSQRALRTAGNAAFVDLEKVGAPVSGKYVSASFRDISLFQP